MKTILNGKWVFDSNILIYALDKSSIFHEQTTEIFASILNEEIIPVVAAQNILETYQVMINGYNLKFSEVEAALTERLLQYGFSTIIPLPKTFSVYSQLMKSFQKGNDLYDFFLSATMLDNGIDQILTNNEKDFKGIKGIRAVNPFYKLTGSPSSIGSATK